MWVRLFLAAVILLGVAICGIYLFLFCAVAASPQATQSFLTLFGFIVACAIPLVAAIFFVGTKNKKNRSRFILGFFFLPAIFVVLFFTKPIMQFFDERGARIKIHDNYVAALNNRAKDPRAAFLSCLLANIYEEVDCGRALEFVNDASFCRTLCEKQPNSAHPPLHPNCSTQSEFTLTLRCAKFMLRKVNPDTPYDVCKVAGLMNFQLGGEYFQGHYYNCLNESVKVGQQQKGDQIEYLYKSLGEILKLEIRGRPVTTPRPLP